MRTRVLCTWILMMALVLPPLARADALTEDPRVASALRLIEVWVETQLAYEAIPGISMGVVHDQDLIWSKGFGHANPDAGLEATPTILFPSERKLSRCSPAKSLRSGGTTITRSASTDPKTSVRYQRLGSLPLLLPTRSVRKRLSTFRLPG